MMQTPLTADKHDLRFPRRFRLKKPAEIRRVFRQGRRWRTDHLQLLAHPNNPADCSRFACVVGRHAGNAVVRNRIKRILREAIRHARPRWESLPNADVILAVTRDSGLTATTQTKWVQIETERLFTRYIQHSSSSDYGKATDRNDQEHK